MSSLSINSAASYYPAFQARSVNPKKDKAYIDPQTGELTTWKPGLYDPEAQEKANKRKKALLTTLVLAVGAAAVWFFTKGKGRPYADKLLKKAKPYMDKAVETLKKGWDKVKNFFGFGKKATQAPTPTQTPTPTPAVVANDVEAQVVRNINTSGVNAGSRKLVEEAAAGTVTKAEQAAYDKAIAYVAPTTAERAAIDANNALVRQAQSKANSIGEIATITPQKARTPKKVRKPKVVTPEVRAQQIQQDFAAMEKQAARAAEIKPTPKIPTSAEIFAQQEAEAARMAAEEAEMLASLGF